MSAGAATLTNIQRGELTYSGWSQVHTYQVFTTDGTDGPDVVLEASGLPSFSSGLTYDPLSRVSRITPIKQEDATTHWHVDVEYSRETGNQQDTQQPPTLRPVKRAAATKMVARSLMKDRHGEPILTGAKTPFNPAIEIQVPHPVVTFTRWEETFTTATIRAYAGRVNLSDFGDYPAGWVMCVDINASEEWEQDENGDPKKYWMVTYVFEACYDEQDTFDPVNILDCDYWFLDPTDSGKRKPIFVDKDGAYHGNPQDTNGATPAPTPVCLAETPAGDVLQASELPDAAHFLNLEIFQQAEFNDLELPVE